MTVATAVLPCTVTRVISKPQPIPRYAVQLCQSATPIEPRGVPQLDLFGLYHLYADVKLQSGAEQHSLRLGFFKEAGTAKTVARYLTAYFNAPHVVQVDAAEIVRSLRGKFAAQKDIGASGTHEAIELVAPRPLSAERQAAAVHSGATARIAPRSLWSRLLGS